MLVMRQDILAFDKKASSRSIDADGHMHVSLANISKATINPYRGAEIPNFEALGLEPDRIYQLLRDPDELAKSAPTFDGKPLLNLHKPQTAADADQEITVGGVRNVRWNAPYLQADLDVWVGSAIAGIEKNLQRELSASYRYDADMTPGFHEGKAYDGVMRNIRGNHVALVENGRAGSDVTVGDKALEHAGKKPVIIQNGKLSRQGLLASGALHAVLPAVMAQDSKIDLTPILRNVTRKTWTTDRERIKSAINALPKTQFAADADLSDIVNMLDALKEVTDEPESAQNSDDPGTEGQKEVAVDIDMAALRAKMLAKGMTDEEVDDMLGMTPAEDADDDPADTGIEKEASPSPEEKKEGDKGMSPPPGLQSIKDAQAEADKQAEGPIVKKESGMASDKQTVTVAAMDAAMKATQEAVTSALRAKSVAARAVQPFIGEIDIFAMDSADAIYETALKANGVKTKGVHPSAFPALLALVNKPSDGRSASAGSGPRVAMDAATAKSVSERFPSLAKYRSV